jgi:hypothetical protein
MRHPIRTGAGIGLLGLAASCDLFHACTLIGCANALTLTFTSPVAYPYLVELQSAKGTRTVDCPSASQCLQTRVVVPEFTPESMLVKITSPAGAVATSVKATLSVSRPNGEHCEPVCTNASATVAPP